MSEVEKKGLKESLELLEGVRIVVDAVDEVLEDGKVGLEDLPKLLPLLQDFQKLMDAVSGIREIPGELKDLDESEVLQLGGKVFEIVKAIKD